MMRGLLAGGLPAPSPPGGSSAILLVPRVELGPPSYGISLHAVGGRSGGRGARWSPSCWWRPTWGATALARRSGAALFGLTVLACADLVLPASMLLGTFAWSFVA
jgi:hypothetical protein